MKISRYCAVATLLIAVMAAPAMAATLATGDIVAGAIRRPGDLTEATFNLYVHTGTELWSDWLGTVDPADFLFRFALTPTTTAGTSYVVDSGANFAAAATLFTNNVNDYVTWGQESDWIDYDGNQVPGQELSYVATENSVFDLTGGGLAAGLPVADLAGYRIDRMVLTINDIDWYTYDLSIAATGEVIPVTGIDLNATLSVEGAPVPEPATMLLLGSGLAGLAGTGLRRRKG